MTIAYESKKRTNDYQINEKEVTNLTLFFHKSYFNKYFINILLIFAYFY
jgi:hypothetical protein